MSDSIAEPLGLKAEETATDVHQSIKIASDIRKNVVAYRLRD